MGISVRHMTASVSHDLRTGDVTHCSGDVFFDNKREGEVFEDVMLEVREEQVSKWNKQEEQMNSISRFRGSGGEERKGDEPLHLGFFSFFHSDLWNLQSSILLIACVYHNWPHHHLRDFSFWLYFSIPMWTHFTQSYPFISLTLLFDQHHHHDVIKDKRKEGKQRGSTPLDDDALTSFFSCVVFCEWTFIFYFLLVPSSSFSLSPPFSDGNIESCHGSIRSIFLSSSFGLSFRWFSYFRSSKSITVTDSRIQKGMEG